VDAASVRAELENKQQIGMFIRGSAKNCELAQLTLSMGSSTAANEIAAIINRQCECETAQISL
jgi:hypothetical protein